MVRRHIELNIVENFRDREGFCVVASTVDNLGQKVEWEVTKQYPTFQGCMDAWAGWQRRMSVEDQME